MLNTFSEQTARPFGDLFLAVNRHAIANGSGESMPLRRREFQLLTFMMNNPKAVVNRYAMLDLIWDYESFAGSNTLEVHLCSLRKKIKALSRQVRIETVRGVGYRLITAV